MATIFKTEAEVFGALKQRFSSPEYAVLPGVRDATGFGASRTIDALMMGLWPSRGLLLHGVEIKVSRGDWLRELRNPGKQETIFRRCDRFWLAVGDPGIVKLEEVPETWGLLVPHRGKTMKVKKQAPELTPEPLDREFLAAVLRRADENMRDPEMEDRVRSEVSAQHDALLKDRLEMAARNHAFALGQLREKIKDAEAFEEKAGIRFGSWSRLDEVAELIRLTRNFGYANFMVRMRRQLAEVQAQAEAIVAQASGSIDALDKLEALDKERTA